MDRGTHGRITSFEQVRACTNLLRQLNLAERGHWLELNLMTTADDDVNDKRPTYVSNDHARKDLGKTGPTLGELC